MDIWIVLSKVLPYLAYPLTVSLFFGLLSLIAIFRGRGKAAGVHGLISLLVLVGASTPMVATKLLTSLESRYPAMQLEAVEQADAIVVLGGGLNLPLPPRTETELNGSGDRIVYGVRLLLSNKAPILMVTGGNVFPQPGYLTEAEYTKYMILPWGVQEEQFLMETASRNTWENAVYSWRMLSPKKVTRVILVTSAFHMPRSVGSFKKAGFEVVPAPVDFNGMMMNQPTVLKWLPDSGALARTSMVIREYLGLWVYKLRGWN